MKKNRCRFIALLSGLILMCWCNNAVAQCDPGDYPSGTVEGLIFNIENSAFDGPYNFTKKQDCAGDCYFSSGYDNGYFVFEKYGEGMPVCNDNLYTQSLLTPIGNHWILIVFAGVYGGYIFSRKKKRQRQTANAIVLSSGRAFRE